MAIRKMKSIKDRNGNSVKVGMLVRVIHVDEALIKSLPEEEREDVRSMQNDVLEVYEIDKYGQAWVEKNWNRGNGQTESHSLGLYAHEVELVTKCS